jgi:DNA-binding GntR family transcriptional regulator
MDIQWHIYIKSSFLLTIRRLSMSEPAESPTQTIADRVSAALMDAIIMGRLAPGQKINEPALARAYSVSRGPLREALRQLEGLHLIRRTPRAGSRVVTLGRVELVEIYQVREALEGMAARLAAHSMDTAEIETLGLLLDQHAMQIEKKKGSEYFQYEGDFDFHYRIIQGSGNAFLIDLLCGELYQLLRMYRYRSSRIASRPQQALAEHRLILDAIRSRDGEYAEILMRRHISTACRNIEQEFMTGEKSG